MEREIAEERIERLFELADERLQDEPELSDRYVELAREIGMRYRVSIPEELRKRFCHRCYGYLKPGVNCRVRIDSKNRTVNYACRNCGNVNRYGF